LDIGVLGYIGIVWPKEHSPEVSHIPPVTPCMFAASTRSIMSPQENIKMIFIIHM